MLTNYLKLAYKVLLRRKFYTAVSLFGIAFTLMVLVICTAMLDELFSAEYPEVNLDRTLTIESGIMKGERNVWSSSVGYRTLDRYARDLPGVEVFAMATEPSTVVSFRNGEKLELDLRRTDAAFWDAMQFDFVEGGPYTAEDDRNGNAVAVLNESARKRLLEEGPAVGQAFRAGGQGYTVVGVVRDVPITKKRAYSEIYVPVGTDPSTTYRDQMLGDFVGILVAEDRGRFPEIKSELESRISSAELPEPDRYETLWAPARTQIEHLSWKILNNNDEENDTYVGRLIAIASSIALLFMLLPALNLINLNLSRILERSSEIGVRKAFGASSGNLVGQFLVESILLTLIGGILGLILSVGALSAINGSDLIPYMKVGINFRVFLYGLGLSLLFGVISGAYPAWRMSRMHPVQALKGKA